jgi:hypothetical protein
MIGFSLDNFYVDGVQSLTALLYVKRYAIVLADLINETGVMNEDVFAL